VPEARHDARTQHNPFLFLRLRPEFPMGTDDSDRIKKWQRFARDGACAPPDANVKQLVAAQSDH
jgi:hypothetical protein